MFVEQSKLQESSNLANAILILLGLENPALCHILNRTLTVSSVTLPWKEARRVVVRQAGLSGLCQLQNAAWLLSVLPHLCVHKVISIYSF